MAKLVWRVKLVTELEAGETTQFRSHASNAMSKLACPRAVAAVTRGAAECHSRAGLMARRGTLRTHATGRLRP